MVLEGECQRCNPSPLTNLLETGHCSCRLHFRGDPSRRTPGHCIDVRCGFIQACRGNHLCHRHHQQEFVGIWLQQIHHPMDFRSWLYPTYHDKHGPHHGMVLVRSPFLVQGKMVPNVDEGQFYPSIRWVRIVHSLGQNQQTQTSRQCERYLDGFLACLNFSRARHC